VTRSPSARSTGSGQERGPCRMVCAAGQSDRRFPRATARHGLVAGELDDLLVKQRRSHGVSLEVVDDGELVLVAPPQAHDGILRPLCCQPSNGRRLQQRPQCRTRSTRAEGSSSWCRARWHIGHQRRDLIVVEERLHSRIGGHGSVQPAPGRGSSGSATWSNCLPRFWPSNSRCSVAGACRSPSATSSVERSLPSAIQR
jgi:hypothetical protein